MRKEALIPFQLHQWRYHSAFSTCFKYFSDTNKGEWLFIYSVPSGFFWAINFNISSNNPHNPGMSDIFQDKSYQLDGIVGSGGCFLQFI